MSLSQSRTTTLASGAQRYYPKKLFSPVDIFAKVPSVTWLLLVVLGLSVIGTTGNWIAWGITLLWALLGPGQAVESLLAGLLLVFLNPGLFSSNDQTLTLRWLVLFVAGARVMFAWAQTGFWRPQWLRIYLIFIAYLVFVSLVQSKFPNLSLAKTGGFALLSLTVYLGVALGDRNWSANLVAFGLIIAFLSLPLLVLPVGYLRNGHQFQGILSHPQSFGVMSAVPFAYLVAEFVFAKDSNRNLFRFLLLALTAYLLIKSGARSGYLAAMLAFGITALAATRRSRQFGLYRILFHPFVYFAAAALIVLVGFLGFSSFLETFLFERDVSAYAAYGIWLDENSAFVEKLFASRQSLSQASWENFLIHPWFGIGLGVPSNLMLPASSVQLGAFAVSVPVEKGFLLTALLEEIGLFGFILFILLTLAQVRTILKSPQIAILCLSLAALLISTTEFFYFSAGGIGVLVHIGIGIGLAHGGEVFSQAGVGNKNRAITTDPVTATSEG